MSESNNEWQKMWGRDFKLLQTNTFRLQTVTFKGPVNDSTVFKYMFMLKLHTARCMTHHEYSAVTSKYIWNADFHV